MEVVVERSDGPAAVALELPTAVEDRAVADTLGLPLANLLVDGQSLPHDRPLADLLVPGAHLSTGASAAMTPLRRGATVLRVTGGTAGGRVAVLDRGRTTVGRSPTCDVVIDAPGVSWVHAAIDVDEGRVTVTDLGSTNGIRVDGRWIVEPTRVDAHTDVVLGDVELHIGEVEDVPAALAERRGDGRTTFLRPPRGPMPADPEPAVVPADRPPARPGMRFSWVSVLVPAALALGMALVFSPLMAAFGVFSIVMAGANWWEDRRRARADAAGGAAARDEALSAFSEAVWAAREAELVRRRAFFLDPAACVERAVLAAQTLWERRPADVDHLCCRLGRGSVAWRPALERAPSPAAVDVSGVLEELGALPHAPVGIRLTRGEVVGIVGPQAPVEALVRGIIVQAVVTSGPADLRVAVLTEAVRIGVWTWAMWLPHARGRDDTGGTRLVAGTPEDVPEVLDELRALLAQAEMTALVVVDAEDLWQARDADVRRLLTSGDVAAIVTAASVERLPAAVTTVVTLTDAHGSAMIRGRGDRTPTTIHIAGAELAAAERCALALARLDDPEIQSSASELPDAVHLADLLAIDLDDVDALASRWRAAGGGLALPIGLTVEGPLLIDLDIDGPHALVAGTTGSGKSELLRSLVAGLAGTVSAEEVTFALIDYKGGSAFDACADLPHTVGVVTDLDETLARRALRSLEAELMHREQVLRDAGAEDLPAYRGHRDAEPSKPPLPRLVVVCDEFATLAAELPDFVDSLLGVAQRGRSLGVHLVLATQRPAGAVSDGIRANTNLRIALRVNDDADALDVVGSAAPAGIARHQRGRGFVRLGPSELRGFQAALVSGRSATAASRPRIAPLRFGPRPREGLTPPRERADGAAAAPSDLARLVATAQAAHRRLGLANPRRPWLPPLPADLPLTDVEQPAAAASQSQVAIGLLDDPARQCQRPALVDLRRNLLVFGTVTSGRTTALSSTALAVARTCAPEEVHLHVIDHGGGGLRALEALPHVGTVAGAGADEVTERLLRWLCDELSRRRAAAADEASGRLSRGDGKGREDGAATGAAPRIVVLVDGFGGMWETLDHPDGFVLRDRVARVIADGPALGISFAVTAERPGAVPSTIAALIGDRLVLELADPADALLVGLRPADVTQGPAGRARVLPGGHLVQLADPGPLETAVRDLHATWPAPRRVPHRVPLLPACLRPEQLALAPLPPSEDSASIGLLLGLGDDGRAAFLQLREGDHLLVTGPPRSGRSSALCAAARAAAELSADVRLVAVAPRRSPLRDLACLEEVASTVEQLLVKVADLGTGTQPLLLLVDDAELVDDPVTSRCPHGVLATLIGAPDGHLHVLAAARADSLRGLFGHWTAGVRRSRLGLALRPQLDVDGELWHTPLPRRITGDMPAGRGFLVSDGEARLVQVVAPPEVLAGGARPPAERPVAGEPVT